MRALVSGNDVAFPLFYAVFDKIVPVTGKFMATIFNSATSQADGVPEIVRIRRYNWDITTTRVSTKILQQSVRFINTRTAGTSIPTRRVNAGVSDTFPHVTLDTDSSGVTFPPMSLILRFHASQGNPKPKESSDRNTIVYERKLGDSGLRVQTGRGLTIQNDTDPGSNPGTVSYIIEWHVDRDATAL